MNKINSCETLSGYLLDVVMAYGDAETVSNVSSTYNKEEIKALFEQIFYQSYGMGVDAELGTFDGLLTSYVQMSEEMGSVNIGGHKAEIQGKEIVVTYDVTGDNCDGTVTFTFSNDIFTRFKSGNAEAHTSFAQKMSAAAKQMGNAGLNTLLGMGSVFIVLILICFIISSFSLFNRTGKKKPAEVKAAPVAAPSAEPEPEELSDDTELVAVITAAICAYEGAGSSDGFVVRSIRKANRRR
ncbi:MAG: OadG family protein [Lachnospiraceae bacterium]|nr:OadG family protein [Lachnospiraceae bacterium]